MYDVRTCSVFIFVVKSTLMRVWHFWGPSASVASLLLIVTWGWVVSMKMALSWVENYQLLLFGYICTALVWNHSVKFSVWSAGRDIILVAGLLQWVLPQGWFLPSVTNIWMEVNLILCIRFQSWFLSCHYLVPFLCWEAQWNNQLQGMQRSLHLLFG